MSWRIFRHCAKAFCLVDANWCGVAFGTLFRSGERKNEAAQEDRSSRGDADSAVRNLRRGRRARTRSGNAIEADARQLANLSWRLHRTAAQPPDSDYARKRELLDARMGFSNRPECANQILSGSRQRCLVCVGA